MPKPPKKNAVERRLDVLQAHWDHFAVLPDARLLIWQVDGDDAQMVEVFLEVQRHGAGEVPDLFIRLQVPFEQPGAYGRALVEEFSAQYEEARTGLAGDSVPTDWVCPGLRPGEDDVAAFVRCCASFRTHYKALAVTHLAVALTPKQVNDAGGWREWLRRLVRAGLPKDVRVTALDSVAAPALAPLLEAEPQRVVAARPALDMPDAFLELVREAGGSGPGHAFRRLFVALTAAGRKGNVAQAERTAKLALAVAGREGWPALQAAVHMALGGVLLGAARADAALASYRAAGAAATAAAARKDPAAPKLLVSARFAEGAALLPPGRFAEAAAVYEATAPVAAGQQNHLMTLEAWRMAAYCHEQAGAVESAWRCGEQALAAGARLDGEGRRNSTLPYVGQGLLRLTAQRPYRQRADEIHRRMGELLGPHWEEALAAGGAKP
jgi:hypothetical protein